MITKHIVETITDQGAVLNAFSRTLGREARALTQYPESLWQQLHNRLQRECEDGKCPPKLVDL